MHWQTHAVNVYTESSHGVCDMTDLDAHKHFNELFCYRIKAILT